MNVNQGIRIEVELAGYSGTAGFSEVEDKATLSFPSPAYRAQIGETIIADGRDWTIEKVGPSHFLRGFKTVELRRAPSA